MNDEWAGWLTTQELLDGAHRAGFVDLTERRIESLRHQNLLARPQRIGQDGRRPVWKSPPSALEELLDLCAASDDAKRHGRTSTQAVLRIHSWLRGNDTDLGDVRADLCAILDDSERLIESELAKVATSGQTTDTPAEAWLDAFNQIATAVAAVRGERAVPPRTTSRSERPFRAQTLQALLHLFYTGQAPDPALATGEDIERGLGVLPRARLDRLDTRVGWQGEPVGPWHDGTPIDLGRVASLVGLPALRRAVKEATDDDLTYLRTAVPILTRQLPPLIGLATALSGWDRFLGLESLLRTPLTDIEAGLTAFVLALRCSDLRGSLESVVEAIQTAHGKFREGLDALLSRPAHDLETRLAHGGPQAAHRVRRVLANLDQQTSPSVSSPRPER